MTKIVAVVGTGEPGNVVRRHLPFLFTEVGDGENVSRRVSYELAEEKESKKEYFNDEVAKAGDRLSFHTRSFVVRLTLLVILLYVSTNMILFRSDKDLNKEGWKKQVKDKTQATTHAVIHIGPHKTGTTTIQSLSKVHFKELRKDGYEMPWKNLNSLTYSKYVKNPSKDGNQAQFGSCFLSGKGASTPVKCQRELLFSGLEIAKRRKNLFVTAEAYSKFESSEIESLSDYLGSWDSVTIVMTYRRLYDLLQSWWNQVSKAKVFKELKLPKDKLSFFQDNKIKIRFDALNLLQKYHERFQNVVVINYHDRNMDLAEKFYCDALPDFNATCAAIRNPQAPVGRKNVAEDDLKYGQIALGAAKMGLTAKYTSPRDLQMAVRRIKKHQEIALGLSKNDFKMKCPPPNVLDALLSKSQEIEMALFPDFYASPLGEAGMRTDFKEQRTTKLCDIDLEETLNKFEWQFFFKNISKRI